MGFFDHLEATEVRLRVRDGAWMARFYGDALGFVVSDLGAGEIEVSAGAGLAPLVRLIVDPAARRATAGSAGLFHVAFLYPDRAGLGGGRCVGWWIGGRRLRMGTMGCRRRFTWRTRRGTGSSSMRIGRRRFGRGGRAGTSRCTRGAWMWGVVGGGGFEQGNGGRANRARASERDGPGGVGEVLWGTAGRRGDAAGFPGGAVHGAGWVPPSRRAECLAVAAEE